MTFCIQLRWAPFIYVVMVGCEQRQPRSAIAADAANLRAVAGLWRTYGDAQLAADGRVDVYAPVRKRMEDDLPPSQQTIVSVYSSERLGRGPTWKQIRGGDYSKFPWRRFRGIPPSGEVFPLLWEALPAKDGRALVAYSDGSVQEMDADHLKKVLQKFGQ